MSLKLSYTTAEAAAALGLSIDKIKQMVRKGELKAVRTDENRGGRFLITEQAMRDWLDSRPVA